MLLQLAFKAVEERDGIRGRACKPGDDLIVVEATRRAGGVFHDVIVHGHLTIGNQHHLIVFAYAKHRCAVHLRVSRASLHPDIIPQSKGGLVPGGRSCTQTKKGPAVAGPVPWRERLSKGFMADARPRWCRQKIFSAAAFSARSGLAVRGACPRGSAGARPVLSVSVPSGREVLGRVPIERGRRTAVANRCRAAPKQSCRPLRPPSSDWTAPGLFPSR